MPENTQPGDLVARLQITGTSSEISTRLVYNSSEVKTNGTNYFSLNFTNLYLRYCKICFLYLIKKQQNVTFLFFFFFSPSALDYEWWTSNNNPNPFRFIVECTILSDQSINNIDFQLDLVDDNDHPPIFNQSIYDVYINETTPINTTVSTSISAYDLDSGIYGMISYYLLTNSSVYSVS